MLLGVLLLMCICLLVVVVHIHVLLHPSTNSPVDASMLALLVPLIHCVRIVRRRVRIWRPRRGRSIVCEWGTRVIWRSAVADNLMSRVLRLASLLWIEKPSSSLL